MHDPEEIARIGILASCEFDNSCDQPITVYSLPLVEDADEDRNSPQLSVLGRK